MPPPTSPQPSTSRRRTLGGRAAGLVISGISILILLGTVDVAATVEILGRAQPGYVALALVALTGSLLVRGWRWAVVLPHRPSGEQVPVLRTISPALIGYLGNTVLPARLGEPIRAYLVARREGLVPLEAFGATMLERLVDVVVLAAIGLIAAVVLDSEWWMVAIGLIGSVAGIAALVLLVVLGFSRLGQIVTAILGRLGLAERLSRLLAWGMSFAAGVDRGRDVLRLVVVIVASLIAWALEAAIFYLCALSLGIDLSFVEAVLVGAIATLATAIPAAPGYVGTFELASTAAAVAVGTTRDEGLALAVLVHVVTVVPIAIAGAVVLILSGSHLGELAEEAVEAETPAGE